MSSDLGSDKIEIVHASATVGRGGGERLMIELANYQAAAGHSVRIIAASDVSPERTHTGLNPEIPVVTIARSADSRVRSYAKLLRWFWANRRSFEDCDILHCHMTPGAILGTLVQLNSAASGRKTPAVVETYHAVGMPMARSMLAFHKWMFSHRNAVAFMVDHPLRHELVATHPNLPAPVIPAGVEAVPAAERQESRMASRRRFAIPESAALVIGTVGRFVPERRPWIYVPIFARITEAMGSQVRFLMGGDGPELERVAREMAEAGLADSVHFPGLITDMQTIFGAMDLYVTLNVGPVPGVAGLQAITAGLPSVAHQLVEDYLDGEQDSLWSSRDPAKIADRAIRLLGSREALAAEACAQRKHVHVHHSREEMAAGYEELYRRAVRAVSGRPG